MYMLWYQNVPVTDRVKNAIEYYQKRYGNPPSIIETPLEEELPEGMSVVVKRVRIPKGNLLVGEVVRDNE